MNTPSPSTTKTDARQRPKRSRTRTRTASARPALALSTLPVLHLDLRPEAMCLVCPDCGTWCAILGIQSRTPLVSPHDTEQAGSPDGQRCRLGSSRRLLVDVTVVEWSRRYQRSTEEAVAPCSRRGTNLIKRPAPKPLAVTQVRRPAPTAAAAHATYRAHREGCTACTGRGTCRDGRKLAAIYVQLLEQEPARRKAEQATEQMERQAARSQARALAARRKTQWGEVAVDVLLAKLNRLPRGVEFHAWEADLPKKANSR